MTMPELRELDKDLHPQRTAKDEAFLKTPGGAKQEVRARILEEARNLHDRIDYFDRLMQHPKVGGKFNLIAEDRTFKTIWANVPEDLVYCFAPEFSFQPEEITAFTISTHIDKPTGSNTVNVELERNGKRWSWVSAGATVKEDAIAGEFQVGCVSEQGQQKDAREGMKKLSEAMWERKPFSYSHVTKQDEELLRLFHDVNALDFADTMLGFAVRTVSYDITNRAHPPK